MHSFVLLATPRWVNFLILVPVVVFLLFRNVELQISRRQLLIAAIFGVAFGFVEASVVVYLRAALGMLPGYMGTLSDVIQQSSNTYQAIQAVDSLPKSLFTVEFFREAATLVMLVTIALLMTKEWKTRFAMFLWVFAFWDLFYYAGLWLTVRWPYSLTTQDVLFLIPVPWLAQIWFPYVVSGVTILAIAISARNPSIRE